MTRPHLKLVQAMMSIKGLSLQILGLRVESDQRFRTGANTLPPNANSQALQLYRIFLQGFLPTLCLSPLPPPPNPSPGSLGLSQDQKPAGSEGQNAVDVSSRPPGAGAGAPDAMGSSNDIKTKPDASKRIWKSLQLLGSPKGFQPAPGLP